ncbi:MAG TPA: pitrilysin family protein [Myxococcota bacterium]|nr:pitrilysin family protein [Myxococcota bacterium]
MHGLPSDLAGLQARAADISRRHPGMGSVRVLDVFEPSGGGQVVRFQLDNGLQVILWPDHSAPLVSFQTWFKVGTVNECGFKNGIAHLFEHLMFKGTERYPHRCFDKLLEEAGAQNNAATWLDWTFYYENLPSEALDLAFDLESDRMVNVVIDSKELDSERDVVLSERRYRVDNDPDGKSEAKSASSISPNHPYGTPTLGTADAIESINLSDCRGFYRSFYQPSNAILVIVGDCTYERAVELSLTRYGMIPGSPAIESPVPPFLPPSAGTSELALDVNSERMRIGWVTVPAGDRVAVALDVANEILFANESSRVFKRLIDDLPLASDVDGTSEPMRLAGTFIVDVIINEGEKAEDALSLVLEEIDRFGRDGPSAAELARACNHLEASFLRSMITVGSRATQLGIWHVTTGDYRQLFTFVDDVRAVDAESVRKAVADYLVPGLAVTILGRPSTWPHGVVPLEAAGAETEVGR